MKQSVIYFILMVIINNIPLISQEWHVINNLDSNSNDNTWYYVKSYDDSNVIVVGSEFHGIPRVIISSDAGKSWRYIFNTAIEKYIQDTTLKFYRPYAVHFDKDKIFILAYDYNQKQPYFITSSNLGKNWSIEKTNIGGNDFYFEGNNGIIFGFDRIFYSSNSGVSWLEKPNNINSTGTIEKIRFSSVNKIKILLVDQTNKKAWIYQTEDMAASWQIDTIPYYCRYRSFAFFDDNTGWVVGSYPNGTGDLQNDVILKTNDN